MYPRGYHVLANFTIKTLYEGPRICSENPVIKSFAAQSREFHLGDMEGTKHEVFGNHKISTMALMAKIKKRLQPAA
jgi:hypothetical protein